MSELELAVIEALEFLKEHEGYIRTGMHDEDYAPNRAMRIANDLRDALERDPEVLAARARVEAAVLRGYQDKRAA